MLGLSLGPHGYFTDARLRTWHRTLDPRTYELRGQAEHWAIALESTPGSPFWVVARYDWSDPDIARGPSRRAAMAVAARDRPHRSA